jgi:hypothetical protein
MKIEEEYESILDSLITEKMNLIKKREEYHGLHHKFQTVKENGIGAKDFRKVENEIKILEDKVEVLYLQKEKISNKKSLNREEFSMISDITFDDLDE